MKYLLLFTKQGDMIRETQIPFRQTSKRSPPLP